MIDMEKVRRLYDLCAERAKQSIRCFQGSDRLLPFISERYPGVWLESSVYAALEHAWSNPDGVTVAENVVNLFLENQTADGQFPCYIIDKNAEHSRYGDETTGYSQIQECMSFGRLCRMVYEMNGDREFLRRCYDANGAWDGWLCRNRMTTGRGLIELFCGYDTGHDNSGRFVDISCPRNYKYAEKRHHNAAVLPPDDGVTPILAPDMNCTFYASRIALAEMAEILGMPSEAEAWCRKALAVKERLFDYCYNAEDAFFYDVDRHGNQRKYLSVSILHLFMEHVLDPKEDEALIRAIYERHLKNPREFWTPYPFPATAVSDPYWQSLENPPDNCWGYYTQTLTLQRCRLWMDDYGFGADFDEICRRWLQAYTDNFDLIPFGQEIHPITGAPTPCSSWSIGVMNFYRYVVQRLGILE